SGRFHLADVFPFSVRHQVFANACLCSSAPSEGIQLTVFLIRFCSQLCFCKFRLIVIDLHIGHAIVFRHFRNRIRGLCLNGRVRDSRCARPCPVSCAARSQCRRKTEHCACRPDPVFFIKHPYHALLHS